VHKNLETDFGRGWRMGNQLPVKTGSPDGIGERVRLHMQSLHRHEIVNCA
jgi:hypothetical protein